MSVAERCSACGAARNDGDRCGYCGALYPDMISARPKQAQVRALDGKYKITRKPNRVKITWRWRSIRTLFLIPFFLFWNSVSFSFADVSTLLENPISLFPIPGFHMIIGIVGTGYVIFELINSTTIDVGRSYLTIKHHPLPWPGHKFAVREIDTLYVSKARRRGENHSWDVPTLELVTKRGRRTRLLKGNTETDFADYESLRHSILEALDIEPKSVLGAP